VDVIQQLDTEIIARGAKLIVIDSIAVLARKASLDEKEREQYVSSIASKLKTICDKCHCAILATNQVVVASTTDVFGEHLLVRGVAFAPALGVPWHHAVTTRLMLSKEDDEVDYGEHRRKLLIAKSPLVQRATLHCTIGKQGMEFLPTVTTQLQ
jgi:RecA/RadA recombinase